MEPYARATVNRPKMLDLVGMMVRVEVKRDDAALARILILRRRDVDVAVAANREMADGAQAFGDDRGVKAGRQCQPVRFGRGKQRGGRRDDRGNTKHLHRISLPAPTTFYPACARTSISCR